MDCVASNPSLLVRSSQLRIASHSVGRKEGGWESREQQIKIRPPPVREYMATLVSKIRVKIFSHETKVQTFCQEFQFQRGKAKTAGDLQTHILSCALKCSKKCKKMSPKQESCTRLPLPNVFLCWKCRRSSK